MNKKNILLSVAFAIIFFFGFTNEATADACSWVYTPNGTYVSTTLRTYEISESEKAEWREWMEEYYPNVVILRDASRKYNCHSYAWHSQSTSNNHWINDPNQSAYWTDGSYSRVYMGPYNNGSRMRYVYGDHSAHYSWSYGVVSKWGEGPLAGHTYSDCPYNSSVIYYYD